MLRRLRPWLVVLGLGLAALLWGLAVLQGMIRDERDEAMLLIDSQVAGLEEYARRTLELRLEDQLGEVRSQIEAARNDPLVPADELVLVEGGRRRLPRSITFSIGGTEAQKLYTALLDGEPIEAEPETPWAERVALFEAFRDASAAGDGAETTRTFQALLGHRAAFVLDSRRDVPMRIAELELLADGFAPVPTLMTELLRDGLSKDGTIVTEGLQRALLRRRARFSAEDFAFLAARVDVLSVKLGVDVEDFRACLEDDAPTAAIPAELDEPALLERGTIYVRPEPPGRILGRRVDLDAVLPSIEEEMHSRGQLGDEDHLVAPVLGTHATPLSEIGIAIDAPRFVVAVADAEQRYWLKTSFVGLCALLALVIFGLGVVMQSRAQKFVELKSGFVSAVSHELRTPLASIRLMAETLERRTKSVPGTRDYPTRIVREIDDLTFLVENLLSFNRLDKGRWQPRRQPTKLVDLIDQLEDDLRAASPREVELEVDGIEGVVLDADPELLRVLLRNLGKNACLYNERDPIRLQLVGAKRGTRWVLELSDNGVGIAPAERGRIFDDFYRAPGTRARGSGLGLAICRHIMEAHDGDIEVARSSPEGTTFALAFPATIVK
jgi:two-component system sensor histidine kinase SenX3